MAVGHERFTETQFSDDARFADDATQALQHADVIDIGRCGRVVARQRAVAQGGGDDRAAQVHRRLQQRGQKAF
jgi:hypothetical protein